MWATFWWQRSGSKYKQKKFIIWKIVKTFIKMANSVIWSRKWAALVEVNHNLLWELMKSGGSDGQYYHQVGYWPQYSSQQQLVQEHWWGWVCHYHGTSGCQQFRYFNLNIIASASHQRKPYFKSPFKELDVNSKIKFVFF